ncbi:MAG: sigma-70 family RNA polymerase sigma factor [Actinomycetota bacterium]|nr:sigma-70 family RNA polymerase sigma factor [Actinomycetota bacterium]
MTPDDAIWEYSEDLRRFARYLCRHPEDAEDVAQNALLKAAQQIDGFRGDASVRTWLHTIATNECRMMRRRATPDSLDLLLATAPDPTGSAAIPTPKDQPEDAAIEAEARRTVVAALERLPANYQRVLVLKDGCGLPSAEIADLLETTVPATKSTLHRARRNLRRELTTSPAG